MPQIPKLTNKQKLIALVGAPAAGVAIMLVQHWEGTEYVGYADVVGIATYCTGVTGPGAVVGKRYTKEECEEADSKALYEHAVPVMKCTPGLRDKPHTLGSAISFAYNVGPGAYCGSTVAKRFRAGDIRGGCQAIVKWNKAGGRMVRGLVNRRIDPKWGEVTWCLKDAA